MSLIKPEPREPSNMTCLYNSRYNMALFSNGETFKSNWPVGLDK